MSFNNTSKIFPYTPVDTGMYGVILPQSSRVLFESDIDSKIQKTKSHIKHLSNAQSHRNTHGGKEFRAKQISLRGQIDYSSKRLALLSSAKKIIIKLNKESNTTQKPKEVSETEEEKEIAYPAPRMTFTIEEYLSKRKHCLYFTCRQEEGFIFNEVLFDPNDLSLGLNVHIPKKNIFIEYLAVKGVKGEWVNNNWLEMKGDDAKKFFLIWAKNNEIPNNELQIIRKALVEKKDIIDTLLDTKNEQLFWLFYGR